MKKVIDEFRLFNYFLSNFYPRKVVFRNKLYLCAEAAFQSAKSDSEEYKKKLQYMNGGQAKKIGKQVKLRTDWEEVKESIMEEVIHQKFKCSKELTELLLATEDCELIEGNTWNDTYWGICRGRGENMLGKILMEERRSINERNRKEMVDFVVDVFKQCDEMNTI